MRPLTHVVFPFDVCRLALNKGFVALLLILSHAVNLVECWKYSRRPMLLLFRLKGNVLRSLEVSTDISLQVFKSFKILAGNKA